MAFDNGNVEVYLNNPTIGLRPELIIEHTIPNFVPFDGYFGFKAWTGGSNDRHVLHEVSFTQLDVEQAAVARAEPRPTRVPWPPTGPIYGGELHLAIAEDPYADGFLPFENVSSAKREVNSLIFSRLFQRTSSGIAPDLAESWEVSEDFKTWTMYLRQDAQFHLVNPVTAADVKFSIETLKESGLSGRAWSLFDGMTILDDYTLEMRFSGPFPDFDEIMAQPTSIILPAYIYDNDKLSWDAPDSSLPVGSGPFKQGDWVGGEHLVLERNSFYNEPGLPYVDRIFIHFIPERNTRIAAFLTGKVDFLGIPNNGPTGGISRDELEYIVQNLPDAVLGPRSSAPGLWFDTQTMPFADMRVRRAIAYAIDQDVLNEALLEGRGERQGPVPKALFTEWTAPLDDPNAPFRGYPYDPEIARMLLAEAGYPDGFETQLTVSARWVEWGSVVAEMLAEVGIATGMGVSPSEHMARIGEFGPWGIPHQGMVLAPFQRFDGDIELFIREHFTSQGTHNYSRWTEPPPEAVLAEFAQSLDPEQRRELVSILIDHLAEEVVVVPLPAPPAAYARSGRVQGPLEFTELGPMMKEVWIGEATAVRPTTTNRPPEAVGKISNQTVDVGDSITLNVLRNFKDPEGDLVTDYGFYLTNREVASGSTITPATGELTLRGSQVGTTVVRVEACDGRNDGRHCSNDNDLLTFTLTVTAPGVSYAFQGFHVISTRLNEYGNHDAECRSRLGNNYRLADWNDLTSWVSDGGSIAELIAGLHLKKEGATASIYPHDGAEVDGGHPRVSYNGNELWNNGRRHFFISRHDHVLPGYFLAHTHIDNYHISLGSWYGEGGTVLCYNPATTRTPWSKDGATIAATYEFPTEPLRGDRVFLNSGTLNGQQIANSNPFLSVTPGQAISGTVNLTVDNDHGGHAVFPVEATPTWGDHQSGYWDVPVSVPSYGTARRDITIDLTAPSIPGMYAIIFAAQAEFSGGYITSATHWPSGSPRWNNGDDIAGWSASQIDFAIANGYLRAHQHGSGVDFAHFGAAAVKIIVP